MFRMHLYTVINVDPGYVLMDMYISKLQLQLQSLMETLNSTEPHYIRCVKPNNVLKPAIFENLNIIQQLRCGVSILWQIPNIIVFFIHIFQPAQVEPRLSLFSFY